MFRPFQIPSCVAILLVAGVLTQCPCGRGINKWTITVTVYLNSILGGKGDFFCQVFITRQLSLHENSFDLLL